MSHQDTEVVDWSELAKTKSELGEAFVRILGYFREDGIKSIVAVEDAFRHGNAAALVVPAHTLKGESAQFGALRLSSMSETIEMTARRCVESHEGPDELIETIVALRPCFTETMALLERDAAPVSAPTYAPAPAYAAAPTHSPAPGVPSFGRRPAGGFGRRVDTPPHGFGRAR